MEPEGRLAHRKPRLLVDPRYARSRTLWFLSLAPEGLGLETRGEAELGERPRPGVLEAATLTAVCSRTSDFCALLRRPPTPSQGGTKDQMRNDMGVFLANCRGPDE